jgi:polyisoprenoid-binding protein YceI
MPEGSIFLIMKTGILLLLIGSWVNNGGDLSVQQDYTLSGNYAVSIHGTFSIHSWVETVQKVSGELVGTVNADGSTAIQSIRMVMEVRSIKSDMGSVMDNKTFKALKADKDPEITFLITAPFIIHRSAAADTLSLQGHLTLAGVTRPVIMRVLSFKAALGTLSIQGEENIKMTDFGVKPPSALFGVMKASPDITINFKTDFIIQKK